MTRSADGSWDLNVYVPAVEFLYQYVLKDLDSGEVVWESTLERKQNLKDDVNMTVHVHDNITSQEDSATKSKNYKTAMIPEIAAGDTIITGDLIKWADEAEDEYESRDSLLPEPTFTVTNTLSSISKVLRRACLILRELFFVTSFPRQFLTCAHTSLF